MGKVRDFAERMWNQTEQFTGDTHPLAMFYGIEELADGAAFVSSFSNITALATPDGLAFIDTGAYMFARPVFDEVRKWSKARVHTAVYTHGHVDHVFGLHHFEKEATERGWDKTRVISHEAVPARFDRYVLTAGYNAAINARQFRTPNVRWPTKYRYPDVTLRDEMTVTLGDEVIELRHARGETDDHVWAWLPRRKIVCTGDLFIWAAPNCGNPQKVQRFPREWAVALREMAKREAETLLPGHGPPIFGAARVRQALDETATLLEIVHDQTLAMMNAGARLDDVLHGVRAPAHLLARPYLRPIYDEPEFIVRNLWRCYGGWYSGVPSELKPSPRRALAREVIALAGGLDKLLERAQSLLTAGDARLAAHLVDWAADAEPGSREAHALRAAVYRKLLDSSTSTMSKGIYGAAARESAGRGSKA